MKLFKKCNGHLPHYEKNSEKRQRCYSTPFVVTLIAILPFCLTGCMGIYESGFECPAGVGVGCKSISDVNMLVNQGEIPKGSAEHPKHLKPEIWYAPPSVQHSVPSIQNMLFEAKAVLSVEGAQ